MPTALNFTVLCDDTHAITHSQELARARAAGCRRSLRGHFRVGTVRCRTTVWPKMSHMATFLGLMELHVMTRMSTAILMAGLAACTITASAPTAVAGTDLAVTTLRGDPRVYHQGDDGHVHELAWQYPDWVHRDVTKDAKAPVCLDKTALAARTEGGDPRVYYQGDDGHVHQLAWEPPNWAHRDLTTDAQRRPASIGLL